MPSADTQIPSSSPRGICWPEAAESARNLAWAATTEGYADNLDWAADPAVTESSEFDDICSCLSDPANGETRALISAVRPCRARQARVARWYGFRALDHGHYLGGEKGVAAGDDDGSVPRIRPFLRAGNFTWLEAQHVAAFYLRKGAHEFDTAHEYLPVGTARIPDIEGGFKVAGWIGTRRWPTYRVAVELYEGENARRLARYGTAKAMPHSLGLIRTRTVETALGPQRHHDLEILLALSDAEYEEFSRADTGMLQFIQNIHFFDMLRWNYEDWEHLLRESAANERELPIDTPTTRQVDINLSRVLLNYLSSIRAYLDHTETALKRRYGANSREATRFKERCGAAFDGVFAYRFTYRLRNFAQHCGIPISHIVVDSGTKRAELQVFTSREHLLTGFDWRPRPLRAEIEALPSEVRIEPYLAEAFVSVEQIFMATVNGQLSRVQPLAQVVLETAGKIDYSGAHPCIFDEAAETTRVLPTGWAETTYDHHRIQVEAARHILRMRRGDDAA
jgi:hypothetical protein